MRESCLDVVSDRVVAFSAHLSEATRLDPGETLLFDAVATNLGDAYNAPTGAFTGERLVMLIYRPGLD